MQQKEADLHKTIDSQRVKIGAYDQLVVRLQRELHESMAGQRVGQVDAAVTRATTIQEDWPAFRKHKDDQL